MKRQSRNLPATQVQSTTKTPSIKSSSQRNDKLRQRSSREFDSRHTSDKQRKSGLVVNSDVYVNHSLAGQSQVREKSSQPAAHRNSRPEDMMRRTPAAQPAVSSKRTPEFMVPKLSSRPKTTESRGVFGMYRAEGMFDLSNLHLNPDHRGSVYNLLEEFKKQVLVPEVTSASKNRTTNGPSQQYRNPAQVDGGQLCNGSRSNHTSNRSNSTQPDIVRRNDSRPRVDLPETKSCGYLSKNRVTTDSEEELLAQIVLSMSRSSSAHQQLDDDESDYVKLWDSESGSSSTSFQTNKDVMGSLMRKKVNRQTSQGDERRNAWMSTSQHTESSSDDATSDSLPHFDMNKFKSLQEKAENMDLTLTDFFTDLKHSSSILELSKSFPSTHQLPPNDCKFKCHPSCEDVITSQCCGPKIDKSHHDSARWSDSKVQHHDADDADSGYSGSGGSAGFTLTKEEICNKIQAYNKSVGLSSGAMTLPSNDSDSFQGCIKVCVCIARPINMSLSSRPTSIYEALHREAELSPQTSPTNTVTAHEKLPQNAVVSLHTDSFNTAIEVVSILLNKFKITDNPKSFALFEQTIQNEKEVKLRKVGDQERPLLNYLRWITEHNESKRFVLKENDSGDIMYEAFSIPELNNFLRVLEQEEAVRLTEIQNKYQVRRKQLADRMRELELEQNPHRTTLKTAR